MADVQASEVSAVLTPVCARTWTFYGNRSSNDEQLFIGLFLWGKKCERGSRLKAKIHILFYGKKTHEQLIAL
jgi:hypothetical protein